jgi:hypothetical protein
MFIFSGAHFKDFMLQEASPGIIGGAMPSGWSNCTLLSTSLCHIIMHVKPSAMKTP